ncbi:MAG: DNA topoisomerase IV subunit A [Erysipelotrichaceae bacterium]
MKNNNLFSENIVDVNFEEILGDRIARYSQYIIQDRALPDVRDGLKPVQRRILYAMNKDGNTYDKAYRKSAKTVGLVIGNYHPHGDSSVYDAMVRLAQDWKMRVPLVDMHGNKGSIDDDPAAAMRYTEARLAKISQELIGDITSDTVDFTWNFDDTEKEPTVLPARYLNLLVNGAMGIAYGYATKIPPHNLKEVSEACIYRLNNPNCTLSEVTKYIFGPDFPTGGIVQGKEGILSAFSSGSGRIVVRAKVDVVDQKGLKSLIISEVPYEVVKAQLVEKIDKIRIGKDLDGISEVRDESDRNGIKIVVELKKQANVELILNYLYKNTPLQVYYNYNMVCIVDKKPMQLGLMNIIDAYLTFYEEFNIRLINYQIDKLNQRLEILEGLIKAISILDEVISLIRASHDKSDAKNRLMIAFDFTANQAEAIVTLQLYRLTSTDITSLEKEHQEKSHALKVKKSLLKDSDLLKDYLTTGLNNIISEYGSKRLTKIEAEVEEIKIEQADLINSEEIMISVSVGGYLKQSSLRSFKASDSYPGLRESDQLLTYGVANTLDNIILSSKSGSYACISAYSLNEFKWKDVGDHVNKFVNFEPNDELIDAFVVDDFSKKYQVVSLTSDGQIRRCSLSDYELSRKSKISSSIKLKKNANLIRSLLCNENDELIIATKNGYINRYLVSDIGLTSINTQGVKALNLGKDDEVVDMQLIQDRDMLVVFAKNGTKRLRIADIEVSNRNKKGILLAKNTKSNPTEIKRIVACNIHDSIIMAADDIREILAKDVSLMDLTATFSNSIKVNQNTSIVKKLQYTYKQEEKE